MLLRHDGCCFGMSAGHSNRSPRLREANPAINVDTVWVRQDSNLRRILLRLIYSQRALPLAYAPRLPGLAYHPGWRAIRVRALGGLPPFGALVGFCDYLKALNTDDRPYFFPVMSGKIPVVAGLAAYPRGYPSAFAFGASRMA